MSNLEQHLQLTSANFINIDAERKFYTNHYGKLRTELYSKLKEEELLGKWLCGHKLEGSYGDNLKVTKPNEFDLVLHLRFPDNDRIIVKQDPRKPGHVTLDLTELLNVLHKQKHNKVTFTNLKKIATAQNLLQEDKLQDLINGAVARALNKMGNEIKVNGKIAKLVYKRCGPAHTICIDESVVEYSVDFVPAIKLNVSQSVLVPSKLKYLKSASHWYAIPKPLKPFEANNISFRASYYEAENAMIKNKYKLKDVIRFMKKFRDSKQNISTLKSYYIKNMLLWEIDSRPANYWKTKQLNEILIDMFEALKACLTTSGRDGQLKYFWDPKLDMFAELTKNQRKDMLNCVTTEIDILSAAAGNFTDEISQNIRNSFSSRQERAKKNKKQSLNQK